MENSFSIQRLRLLRKVIKMTEGPLMVLGFIWLGLLIFELLNKSSKLLNTIGIGIWILFIIDFIIKFIIAPSKIKFFKKNILTAISLIVPAFRLFRIIRVIRFIRLSRSLRLVKVIGSLNRGMNSLSFTMKKRAFPYIMLLTIIVILIGAAGLFAFEKGINNNFSSYSESLWITAMLVASIGTEWPVTTEGRILCFILALYGLAVFGYITATLATFFIGHDIENQESGKITTELKELQKQIQLLKDEIHKKDE